MTRATAIARAEQYLDGGAFKTDLARRVAIRSESQNQDRTSDLHRYIESEMKPALESLGVRCRTMTHPKSRGPFLYGERIEDARFPTMLCYAHGDVIAGQDDLWKDGLSPWQLVEKLGCYYGRGTADNKGQHTINIAALEAVLGTRGHLGFNAKWLIEMGEEIGSPGLRELCADNRALFAADIFISSDGPRLSASRPSIFMGNRGAYPIDLTISAREGAHHSGNWGGLLANPAIQLAHAIATIVGPSGRVCVPELLPEHIPDSIKRALADCEVTSGPDDPLIDPNWGEPGLTSVEKLYAWSTFEILAMSAGTPESPVNAIPPSAWARAQVRFVVGVDPDRILPALRRHLDLNGFAMVEVTKARDEVFRATRLDPDHPWVQWATASITKTAGRRPAVLPNFGGSLPNDIFSEGLGLPTIWVPHSYPGCSQHAPDEHLPLAIAREGLALMAGLYWDLGEPGTPARSRNV